MDSARADQGLAALLLAVDPAGLGGAVLRGPPGPGRDAWLARLRTALPADVPWRRLPPGIPDSRLLGGLDLAATLASGRRVAERGVLAAADGGVVVAAMAERMERSLAAKLCAALDDGTVSVQRDGFGQTHLARFALLALDEGAAAEEAAPAALADRLAFHLDPDFAPEGAMPDAAAARARLAGVAVPPALAEALCGAALAFGIASLRAPLLALRAARAAAA
ncbi:AAA domain-containing protein, partial [Roseomonas sp. BU-1]|nr:AAA domain-containing protein [Falsiroseomonas selenitidurans]